MPMSLLRLSSPSSASPVFPISPPPPRFPAARFRWGLGVAFGTLLVPQLAGLVHPGLRCLPPFAVWVHARSGAGWDKGGIWVRCWTPMGAAMCTTSRVRPAPGCLSAPPPFSRCVGGPWGGGAVAYSPSPLPLVRAHCCTSKSTKRSKAAGNSQGWAAGCKWACASQVLTRYVWAVPVLTSGLGIAWCPRGCTVACSPPAGPVMLRLGCPFGRAQSDAKCTTLH